MATISFRWLLAATLAAPLAATAQTMPVAPGPNGPATDTRMATGAAHVAAAYHAAPPEQRATRMAQRLATELHLDAATTAKVQAAALVRAQAIDAIQTGTATNKEKNAALQANAHQFKSTLQSILTPAQFAQYTSKMGKTKMAAGASTEASE